MKLIRLLAVVCIGIAATAAFSHSDEFFDAKPSPHGGQVRMAGAYHFELVVEEGLLTVFVTDHADTAIATEGASAVALVEAAKVKSQIKLLPAGANVLKGSGQFVRDPGMRVKLTVNMPGAKAQTARFTPLKPRARATQP
jgi:hypothetical protein